MKCKSGSDFCPHQTLKAVDNLRRINTTFTRMKHHVHLLTWTTKLQCQLLHAHVHVYYYSILIHIQLYYTAWETYHQCTLRLLCPCRHSPQKSCSPRSPAHFSPSAHQWLPLNGCQVEPGSQSAPGSQMFESQHAYLEEQPIPKIEKEGRV